MIGHNSLSGLAASLSRLVSDALKGIFGAGLDRSVFGPISLADVETTFCLLLFTLIANGLVAALLRSKRKAARADAKETKRHFLQLLGNPLYLLVWIVGVYIALTPLVLKMPAEWMPLKKFFDKLLDLGGFIVLLWLFIGLTHLLERRLAALAAKTKSNFDDLLVPLAGKSLRVIIPVMGIIFALPILNLPPQYADVVSKGSSMLIIGAIAWILFEVINAGETALLLRHDITVADNLQARKIYTQVKLMVKALHLVVSLCTVACILMLFQQVRHIGASLLASAGIAGIIAGIAAQKTLANLIAGFQIAMAQPMRQGDVVIAEGSWGTIEEITLTYVVVHVWDDTRLVLPLTYFIEHPFQNWTRSSSRLLGSVFVSVDYSFPVEEGRQALKPIIENHPLWDKRFWNLQVSDATEKTMQLRVLATASDSSKAWDLRCAIREAFIAYIQKNHPQCLPRTRVELDRKESNRGELNRDFGPSLPTTQPQSPPGGLARPT
jgi:small-conductance mechanosensitive channel